MRLRTDSLLSSQDSHEPLPARWSETVLSAEHGRKNQNMRPHLRELRALPSRMSDTRPRLLTLVVCPKAWCRCRSRFPPSIAGAGAPRIEQPFCFEIGEGELFAFAGLWDRWKDASGGMVETCSILTTTPNAVTAAVHDRMPVILDPDSYDLWLDPGMRNVDAASELPKPFDARLMRCFLISTRINHVANDDEGCSRPVELAHIQDRLFRSEIVRLEMAVDPDGR